MKQVKIPTYINSKIFGVPKPLKKGARTGYKKKRHYPYVHSVSMRGYQLWKVHIKRQNVSKIKYFKTLKEAKLFVDMLRENKYL